MSRLDSAIRRLEAQRLCLDEAAVLVAGRPGHILEIGLGNGRTYDHLRCLFPERDIYCFDRRIAAHPDCIPDDGHMFLGDLAETLPLAAQRLGPAAVLAHADIGSGDRQASLDLAIRLAEALPPLLARAAVIIGDQPLPSTAWTSLDLPAGVVAGRYHMYRTAPLAGA
ncbi:MAG: hypothetical protein J4G15_02110 [Alphaproteobacteria bacterium]|nr:hypothetical protein [Alphaproteobacteria bacterium]